jgi:type IV pilus assembly protein PilY1
MKFRHTLNKTVQLLLLSSSVAFTLAVNAVTWPGVPLGSTTSALPMTMLVAGKDHKFFYEAYNDASDIGGGADGGPDGKLDIRFDPKITYYGLFDSELCYEYDSSTSEQMFKPKALAGALNKCSIANQWSGNWLNYMTTSRIDAMRKVLYGGYREIDTTTRTVLRRAYIPQDAHSWGKEYHSVATDGYDIGDYTDLAAPTTSGERIFFGNLTANQGVNCATLANCSDNLPPVLRIRDKVGGPNGGRRIWEWASKERPVLAGTLSSGAFPSGTVVKDDMQIRVEVCTPLNAYSGCKQYPNGGSPIYKPVGLLHEYGETNAMLFGLMTGSYDNNMSGGRLRKVVSSFSNELQPTTGIFNSKLSPAGSSPIVSSFDNLRIRDYNNGRTDNAYRGGWQTSRAMNEGEFVDWGNPIGEILYEATRYFAGKKAASLEFNNAATGTTRDQQVGLPIATWDDPYINASQPNVAYCSRASFLTISDINPSFDSDQLPGSYFSSAFTGDLTGLNVKTRADTITSVESNITGMRFIGQSEGLFDSAPTAKNVLSLGSIRGMAPEEPTKQGSYYAASVAYYSKTTDLRSDLQSRQSIDNYVVALSSPLPKIEVKLPGNKIITMVPFAKSVGQGGASWVNTAFQPTNQIVDFYVEKLVNQTPNEDPGENGGRYSAEFQINFEDVEQGADHDMDVVAKYVVKETASGTLSITVTPTYQAGGIRQNMGYVISGTTADGVYLVAQDEPGSPAYRLNVPAGRTPGYCNTTGTLPADCAGLPRIGDTPNVFTFTPGSTGGATLLKDPLWYAAKYGGFADRNNSNTPDLPLEWDVDGNGVPDTYFLVQNPLKLRESLKKAFDGIVERNGSGGNVIANSTVLSTNALVYQATFNSANWSGNLEAYPVTGTGVATTVQWRASDKLPLPDSRKITFWSPSLTTGAAGNFTWATMDPADQALLGNDERILKFIRGDRSGEIQNATPTFNGFLRDRAPNNVLGDIAHSSPFYVKDTDTVYVGANDGMLHAFNATTGVELFAHIPSPMLPKLKALTSPAYKDLHQYFVDGDTVVSSVSQTTQNYLVTALGRGAKGLFGLDVTNPANFDATKVLWEYVDGVADPDLGHMLGRPVLAKMKNGDWAVILGNGYNSTSQKAVLYIFKLSTGAVLAKIDTGVAGDNGMATPGVHLDANGLAETIYAGDLKGNVWKFDVSSTDKADWKIPTALGTSPFFRAVDGMGNPQPITAPIKAVINTVAADPNQGKLFLHFGTGSDFQVSDPSNTAQQSWYGLIDEGSAIANRSGLVSRTMNSSENLAGRKIRSMSAASAGDMIGKSGFVIDLPESAERIVTASNFYILAEPVLIASSVIPTLDLCEPGGIGYLNAINPFTGARLTKGFFDVTGDGGFADDVDSNGFAVSSIDLGVGKPGEAILIGGRLVVGGSKAVIKDIRINLGLPSVKGRISWREIIRD